MRKEKLTKGVQFKMTPENFDNMKKNLPNGHTVSTFVRMVVINEIERLETYNKEKTQTWDIE